MRSIAFLWEMIHHEQLDRAAYRDARVHRIGAEKEMSQLSVSSKLNAEREFLDYLFALGRSTAASWLEENLDNVGVKTTWFPSFLFEESLEPAHLHTKTRESTS